MLSARAHTMFYRWGSVGSGLRSKLISHVDTTEDTTYRLHHFIYTQQLNEGNVYFGLWFPGIQFVTAGEPCVGKGYEVPVTLHPKQEAKNGQGIEPGPHLVIHLLPPKGSTAF